jgi:hypothetical protein
MSGVQDWFSVAQAAAPLVAAIAAFAAWQAAAAAERSVRSQAVTRIMQLYASDAMLDGILAMTRFRDQHGENFADIFRLLREANDRSIAAVDYGRRRFSEYFSVLATLWELGLISERDVRQIVRPAQRAIYKEMVEPLERQVLSGEPDGPHKQLLAVLGLE